MKINQKLIPPLEAAGLTGYVTLVVTLMSNMEKNSSDGGGMVTGIIVLLLFVTSALISASIMLGYPALLFFRGEGKTALKIVLQSIGWLLAFLALIIIIFVFKK